MPTVINQKASQSLRGESVIVTLDATDSLQLPNLNIGDQVLLDNGKVGIIKFVDTFGHSFKIGPLQPDMNLSTISNINGYLEEGEPITF